MTETTQPSHQPEDAPSSTTYRKARGVPSVLFSWFWIALAVSVWASLIALAMNISPANVPPPTHWPLGHEHEHKHGVRHGHGHGHGHGKTHAPTTAATSPSTNDKQTGNEPEAKLETKQPVPPTKDPRMSMLVGDPAFDLLMNDEAYTLSSNLAPLLLFMANNQNSEQQTPSISPAPTTTLPDDERIFGNLNAQERVVLKDFDSIWGHLNADKRQMLRLRARTYSATADDQLTDALSRWDDWSALTPEARQRVQNNHDMIQALSPRQQKALMQAEARFHMLPKEAQDALLAQLVDDTKAAQRLIKTQWGALTTDAPENDQTSTSPAPQNEQVELKPVGQ